ncbi:MAG: hypothetical protein P8172_09155 [Gammaproteobacteria bacterium]|jgi:hypothetical protein
MTPLINQFQAAVLALVGHEPIKQRLVSAYSDHLSSVREDELPRRLTARFAGVRRRLHTVTPLNGEGAVRASVRKMSGPEAAECARIIVGLYGELSRHTAEGGEPLHLVRAPELETVPDLLLKP